MSKKKILSVFLVGIICFGLCFSLINAASKYYDYRWTNEVEDSYDHDYYITNDIIETGDGYVTAGFYDGSYPSVRFLNKEGLLIKEVEPNLDGPQMTKRIFAVDGGYLVVGMDGYGVSVFTINSETYKIIYSDVYWTDDFDWDDEVYFEEDGNYVYLISDWSDDSVVRIDKSFENPIISEISRSGFSKKVSAWVEKYIGIWDLEENYDVEDDDIIYYPTFVTDYADGYVYGYEGAFYYIVDGKVEWMFENEDAFIKDGIQLGNNFVVTYVEWIEEDDDNWSEKSYLEVFDVEGNSLGKDDIANYIDEEALIFYPEHLVAVGNSGFALTGSEQFYRQPVPVEEQQIVTGLYKPDKKPEHGKRPDGERPDIKDVEGMAPEKKPEDIQAGPSDDEYPVSSQVLYFDMIHEIITKTDGNGTITATKVTAHWGEGIEFTIEPKDGFVLSEVRVTDANGNVVTFKDYKFIMPNADVIIEATFSVKNPETYAFIGIALLALVIGGTMFIISKKNKPSKYNN